MNSKLSHWCEGFIEAGWVAAVIAIPLFFNIHSDRVFEPDKLTLLRSIALLMSAAWLVKFVNDQAWRDMDWRWKSKTSLWRRPFVLPVFLLVIVYLISTLFSITPQVSWAGSYQRLQGTYTTLSYIVVFALVATTMRTRAQVNRVVTAVIITSIPIAFYGILQHFNLDPLPWGGDTQVRVAGHMGNAIFIAAYLILVVPLTLARIIDAFTNILNDEELSYADVIRASIYIFALALQLLTIYWSSSRGPWLGLAVGMFAFVLVLLVSLRNADASARRLGLADLGRVLAVVFVGFAVSFAILLIVTRQITAAGLAQSLAGPMASFISFAAAVGVVTLIIFILMASGRGWRWLWLSWILLAVFVAIWLGAFNFADTLDESLGDSPVLGNITSTLVEWKQLPSIGRLGQLIDSESRTGTVRLLIWEGALDLIRPHEPLQYPDGSVDRWNFLRPFIGYGPEAMYVAYNRFYPPELATVEARNASPDRSHNETFDALVITGLLGFAVWQLMYLSVFYYGFRWLGVLRTSRERNLLIALWIGMGALAAVLFASWRGAAWIGVAFPFGSMGGLVIYLVYYAFFSTPPETPGEPFEPDSLLMIGLLAAVLAHYVEIHFGIAIAATRLHFFVYVGLMFVVGYILPRMQETAVATPAGVTRSRKRRTTRAPRPESSGVWGPVIFAALMLTLMIGIMGFQFVTFSPVPGETYTDSASLTTAMIFRQSFFMDSGQDFIESPYAFVMLVLTWILGVILMVAELIKTGEFPLTPDSSALPEGRQRLVGGLFLGLAVIGLGLRFLLPQPADAGPIWFLGRMLLLIWAAMGAWAAARLLLNRSQARLSAGLTALAGLLLSLPVMIAGGVVWGLVTAVLCGVLLWLVWSPGLGKLVLPVGFLAFLSLSLGLLFAFVQASLLRASLFVRPTQELTTQELLLEFRVYEASQSTSFLTLFYVFVVLLLIASAFALSWQHMTQTKESGSTMGYVSLVGLFLAGFILVSVTNMRVVQADMVYKRGKPFDQQAGNQRDVQSWDTAIAIYNKAIDMAPREDFYYLFLGRAILERSALTEDAAEKRTLLNEALAKLERAQAINPLNTDHTANLARLNTRWAEVERGTAGFAERLTIAEDYYQDALLLSPQNSVIRNEFARLVYSLGEDCERSLALFDEAIAIDPYFQTNYFGRSDTLISCAADQEEAAKAVAYEKALSDIETGLEMGGNNLQAWLRAAQLHQELGNYEAAIAAYETARQLDKTGSVAPWQFDYQIATLYRDMGDMTQAIASAQQALALAPAEAAPQVQLLLQELTGEPVSEQPAPTVDPTTLTGERPLAQLDPAARNNAYNSAPPFIINPERSYEAIITTDQGDMRLRLFAGEAPVTVNNFVFLASQGFYDGTTFHRVIEGFMAQGGDPTGTGSGGPGYQFEDETSNGLVFDRAGLLAMANAGPNTNGSQFFITFAPTSWLDGNHTIFGEIIAGEEVLNALTLRDPQTNPTTPGDTIQRIEIIEGE